MALYSFPTLVDCGAGAIKNLPQWIVGAGTRALLVTDPGVVGLPLFAAIRGILDEAGVPYDVFSDVHPDPWDTDVTAGAAVYRETGCDVVVGIGGGSALDACKGIALMGTHPGNVLEYTDNTKITGPLPPIFCVPTTAGTGSEVGRAFVVVDTSANVKVVVFSPRLMPKAAIIDAELHTGLPPHLTAATGMDALTHCMEAICSLGFHPMADSIALGGIRLIHQSLKRAVDDGSDLQAREYMALAATMGATAFQKGLGVIHSLAHPCSTVAKVHHGLANGVLIETGMRFNLDVCAPTFARIARMLELGGADEAEQAEACIQWVADLRDSVGIPANLRSVGVTEAMLPEMERQALADFCHTENPKPVGLDDIKALYRAAL